MDPFVLVLLGATGDLARMKIFPALYLLFDRGLVSDGMEIFANGRKEHTEQSFRDYVGEILKNQIGSELIQERLEGFLAKIRYRQGDITSKEFFIQLEHELTEKAIQGEVPGDRIFHLAISPNLYDEVLENIGESGLNKNGLGFVRLLIEKPFGYNLQSARLLDKLIARYFSENQIYRIDHYLGKEPVQNILAFRFANGIFEPLWNKDHIDHIQIQMLEDFGIKGRGNFYDKVGALRDVVQNHLLQLMAVTMMEEPEDFSSEAIRNKRCELLSHLSPIPPEQLNDFVVRGQYQEYLTEHAVAPESEAETFVALKAEVNTPRWEGVPVLIKAGKKLARTVTEVSIVFKGKTQPTPNVLTLRISPNEGIAWRIQVKRPGPEMKIQEATMQFCYKDLPGRLMEPYEKLLLDAIKGDQTLFTKTEAVEYQWRFIDPILQAFTQKQIPLCVYEPGSWGPEEADKLLCGRNCNWLEPSLDVCPL